MKTRAVILKVFSITFALCILMLINGCGTLKGEAPSEAPEEVKGIPPPNPQEFKGGSDSADYAHFHWRKADGAESYNFYQKVDSEAWRKVGSISKNDFKEDDRCNFFVKGLQPDTRYFFKVTSVNACGESQGIVREHHTNKGIEVTQKDYIDIFKPDNSPDTAVLLEQKHHNSYVRTISANGDVDYFKFKGKKGKRHWIRCGKLFIKDTYFDNLVVVTVYDSGQNRIDISNIRTDFTERAWDGFVEYDWKCPQDGWYYIKVETHAEDTDGLARYIFNLWFED